MVVAESKSSTLHKQILEEVYEDSTELNYNLNQKYVLCHRFTNFLAHISNSCHVNVRGDCELRHVSSSLPKQIADSKVNSKLVSSLIHNRKVLLYCVVRVLLKVLTFFFRTIATLNKRETEKQSAAICNLLCGINVPD